MRESVLVTGGSGFIGTWVLRRLLDQQVQPVVYDLAAHPSRWSRLLGHRAAEVTFAEGDLADRERLEAVCDEHQVTRIIHLGALLTPACQSDPWLGCQVNVLGSVALLEYARRHSDRIRGFSYASSLAVYGPEADDVGELTSLPLEANSSLSPPNFYGVYKQAVEQIANQYWHHFGLSTFGVRPHIVYGPERTVGLTAGPSLAARAAARHEHYQINYTGAAGYDYVEDVAEAFVRGAWETPRGATVVDLPSEPATPEEIVALLGELVPASRGQIVVAGDPIPSNRPRRRHLITALFPDWIPTSLRDGFRKTVDFYRES